MRAFLLKQDFQDFWKYKAVWRARQFLDAWTTRAMRSKNPHFKRFARTLREHRVELMNWFRARGQLATGDAIAITYLALLNRSRVGRIASWPQNTQIDIPRQR